MNNKTYFVSIFITIGVTKGKGHFWRFLNKHGEILNIVMRSKWGKEIFFPPSLFIWAIYSRTKKGISLRKVSISF